MGVDCQGVTPYTRTMNEVAKNVFISASIARGILEDPSEWLEEHDSFRTRYIGGIHNLSLNDKKHWADDNGDEPLRLIETGTGREEVWYPTKWKAPNYISLDPDGNITSHLKHEQIPQPSVVHSIDMGREIARQKTGIITSEFRLWHDNNRLHRKDMPAVLSDRAVVYVDCDYIVGFQFRVFREFWVNGEWSSTLADDMMIIFNDMLLNKPEIQRKAVEWIAEHCHGGFFPFEEQMFGDEEEEFLFVTDVCTRRAGVD